MMIHKARYLLQNETSHPSKNSCPVFLVRPFTCSVFYLVNFKFRLPNNHVLAKKESMLTNTIRGLRRLAESG